MDPDKAMEVVSESAKAVTKFQEILQKVFGPRWTRKQADADVYADLKKLEIIRENPDMMITFVDGQMNAREKTAEELAERARRRMYADAVRQEENIEGILNLAAQQLEYATNVSSDPVDEDWIARYFDIVKDIGADELQHIWSKILAGEINKPKSFSLRTLDTVRNLSSDEAKVFQKLCNYALCYSDGLVLPNNMEILRNYGITFDDFVTLNDAGLLNSSPLKFAPKFPKGCTMHMQLYNAKYLIHITGKAEVDTRIDYSIYRFSKVGAELFSIIEASVNEEYMLEIAKDIAHHNSTKVDVRVHNIISHIDDIIQFDRKAIIEIPRVMTK